MSTVALRFVYVVWWRHWDGSGGGIIGIYTTEAAARDRYKMLKGSNMMGCVDYASVTLDEYSPVDLFRPERPRE